VFDKATANASQRWLFNYIAGYDNYTNLTSIGTTINIWENNTLTTEQITREIESFINGTKQQ